MQDEGLETTGNPTTQESPSQTSQSYQYEPPKKKSPRRFLYLLGLVLLALVAFNVVRFLGSNKEPTPSPSPSPAEVSTPEPKPEETIEPTPTPKPTPVSSIDQATGLDRKDLSVEVQNGSGGAGVAGKAADILRSLGYNVIKTGNADNFNYTNVTIRVKLAQKDFLPLLNKDLTSNNYSVGSTSTDLSATSSAEALVIVGK